MAKDKRICECGHPESGHADYGFRRCAKQGCPCEQYLEDDDPVLWQTQQMSLFDDVGGKLLILVVATVILARCLSTEPAPKASTPAIPVPIVDTTGKDSGIIKCPGKCECWPDGTIKSCPDPKPPDPPRKRAVPIKDNGEGVLT
jgi:hypothetical protein